MKKEYMRKVVTLVFFAAAISLFVLFRSDFFREKKHPEISAENYSQNTGYFHPVDSPPPAGTVDTQNTATFKPSPESIRLMSSKSMVILPEIKLDSLIKTTVSE